MAGRWLFQGATWNVPVKENAAIVGRNGTGKSTLLKLITGQLSPSEGKVQRRAESKVAFFSQDLLEYKTDRSVLEVAREAFGEALALQAEMDQMMEQTQGEYDEQAWAERFAELQARFQTLGGYEMEARIQEVLSGLGFRPGDAERPFSEFSGGWRMRILLAKLLLSDPDILLLDEPTNHLDLPTIDWLVDYLKNFHGGTVSVSHDRNFLNRLVTEVVEIRNKRLHFYTGNYDKFLEEREERKALHLAAYQNQQKLIADTERFIERFRYKATKANQVQSRVKQLEKLDRVPEPEPDEPEIKFRFRMAAEPGREVMQIDGLQKAYDDLVVLEDTSFELYRGDKIGLVGPNGIGKSTLLRIIGGLEEFDGERWEGIRVKMALFAQHQLESLEARNTILEELLPLAEERGETFVRNVMGGFMFSGDEIDKSVGVLSGGERARVALAKVLMSEANVLLLDEPTNHLDIPSIEVLIEALNSYEGSYVIISHNKHLLRHATNKVWFIEDKQIKTYPGSFSDFEPRFDEIYGRKGGLTAALEKESENSSAAAQKNASAKPPKKDSKKLRRLQNRADKLEKEIESLETKMEAIRNKMQSPEISQDFEQLQALQAEIDTHKQKLETKLEEWESVTQSLEEMNA